ncbi:GNAT family N-acetyltransferase [Cohnella candidum]|uniref:GNAT family N-acetyltransferase n=1 Tax=Cohnella candidum TaxID=2674991 RepID=A0A3G3JXI5_9BACL|nr:GNAT family N-acetyltransferase [Cohnella candidum]AYQ72924.1 GNAT family N-acetyltransferase [Cohnella candidum]
MAVVSRLTTKSDLEQAVRLSDVTFRDAEQPSMGGAFPYIFGETSPYLSFGAFDEEGRLVSFMGLVPWEIRIGEAKLRAFALGSVCTDPDARGKGYASEILSRINEYTRRAGGALLLVSGYRSLYTRTGCAPFGRVRRYGMSAEHAEKLAAGPAGETVREMSPDDLFALQEVAAARPVRYHLGVLELAALLRAEALASCIKMKHRVLVAEQDGRVKAFAVIGVPMSPERRGVVIEQAGDSDAVARLTGEAVRRYGLPGVDVPVPWHETGLHAALVEVPSAQEDHLGTVRIVDGDALLSQLRPWFGEVCRGLRLVDSGEGNWRLSDGEGNAVSLSSKDLVRLIFDCASAENEPLPEGAKAFEDLFPVPFPYTAGLCYT